jgi:hypothetical protein
MGRLTTPLLIALACACPAIAGGPGVKTEVAGGTVAAFPSGSKGTLDLTGTEALVLLCRKTELRIPYGKVNTLEYGQKVGRRYASAILISPMLLLSKARKHYVTLGFVDAEGHQQALVFRVGKGDIRSVLASLEARTGRRVEYQDDEARKGGKG